MYFKKIHIAFQNGSNYNYQFIIKQLAKEFENNFLFKRKQGKYITLTIQTEIKLKELIKMEKKLQKNISYILHVIDSERFMASSLSNLVNNLSQRIHKIKCKYEYYGKKFEI